MARRHGTLLLLLGAYAISFCQLGPTALRAQTYRVNDEVLTYYPEDCGAENHVFSCVFMCFKLCS